MDIPPFRLEEFWKKYEFKAHYILCSSGTETWRMNEILELADSESKQLWNTLSLDYTESQGFPLLRKEIASLYASLDPDQIVTFAGAEEGIYCAMRTLIRPKDHVVIISPFYQSLGTLPHAFGAEITEVILDPKNGWELELDQVQKAMRPNTRLLILNYPHNPTGTLISKSVYEGMIELARKREAYIFDDEVYRFLEIEEERRLPSIADAYERGIALNVMTKSFGLGGLRIGWLAAQDREFLQKAASYKLYTSICNSGPSEILALMALRAKDAILQRNRQIMLQNLDRLATFIKKHSGLLSWIPPESGPMALIELLHPMPIAQFAEELVKKAGVLIIPGTLFDLPGNFFRIGFGKKNFPKVLDRFEHVLNSILYDL